MNSLGLENKLSEAMRAGAKGYADPQNLDAFGPVHLQTTGLVQRYSLRWVAGLRGKPGINADIQNAAESVRMIADPDFEVLGTNGTTALSTFYAEGGVLFTTDTGATDSMILAPHLDTSQTGWSQITWGTDQQTEWECDISTNATITNEVIWAGLKLTNTSVTATDADQVFFRYAPATNDGEWQAIYSVADVDVAVDTNIAVAASTRYHLKITINAARAASFFINGVLAAVSTILTDATDLIPYIGVLNSSGAAHAIRIHGQAISRVIA